MKNQNPLHNKRTALAVAISSVLMASAVAVAQENDSQELEEVVVHGKFQQSLINRIAVSEQELPFTLDVIDSEFLEARNFTRPIEALTTLPNIARFDDRVGSGTTSFRSRGFYAPILVDNRHQNDFRGMGARDNSFVERYEVLKGPASIASGPVGAGGIINTVTKTPHADKAYSIKLRADQFGSAAIDFDANLGEIADGVLFRVSGAQRDFSFNTDAAGRTTSAIRPVVVFDLGSNTTVKASAAYRKVESNPNFGLPLTTEGEIPEVFDMDTFGGLTDGTSNTEDTLLNVEVNHEFLDNLALTVRGSKQWTDNDYKHLGGIYGYSDSGRGLDLEGNNTVYVVDNAAVNAMDAEFIDAQLSYETSLFGEDANIVVGVARSENTRSRDFPASYEWREISLSDVQNPIYGWDDVNYGAFSTFDAIGHKLQSVYSEAVIRPLENLTVIAGVRLDELEQTYTRRGSDSVYDDSEITTRLGGSYSVSDELNVYASFAQAFVPQYRGKADGSAAEAETSDGIELGVKGTMFGDRVSFSAAVFSTTRKNIAVTDPNNTDFAISIGELDVQGFEFSSVTKITDAISLSFNYGSIDIELSEKDEALGVSLPVFPKTSGSLYLNYAVQSGALDGLSVGGGFRHVGESEGWTKTWGSYNVADLNFAYRVTDDIKVSLDVLNLTDELYIENTASSGVNRYSYGAVFGAPRTVTMSLRWDF